MTEFLMATHSLAKFEIQKYYQKEPWCNSVYIVWIGVSTSSKTHPLLFPKPPLNLKTVQGPLFVKFPPICWFYMNPIKIRFFSKPL